MTDRPSLERIFDPASIAVVGASTDPAKRGYQIVKALAESGYEGSVHPVNPRGGELLGLPVTEAVEDLPEGVDLAVLCTPASMAPDLVRSCGARRIAGAVVLAVGFGEAGAEGASLEGELVQAGREAGVRIMGPNTSGMLNLHRGVNLVGARGVRPGGLSVLVQSGNMALALMTEVTERSWDGLSVYLGVGNQVDLGFAEALEYLEDHDGTHAVMAYVEGLRKPGDFLSAAARVGRTKPIVLLKSGRTERGAEAALSHTGAVAGPYHRLHAGLAQAGVVELTRADELLHVAETLGRQPVPASDQGIAILSDGGGQGTLAVDWLTEAGARLATLSEATRHHLRELLGSAAAVSNPVDLAGAADGDPAVFGEVLKILVADPSVGTVLVIGLFGGYGIRFADSLTEREKEGAEGMASAADAAGRGLVVHTMYAAHRSAPLQLLGEAGVPVVGSLEVACRCVTELQRRGEWLAREPWAYQPPGANGGSGDEVEGGPDDERAAAPGDEVAKTPAGPRGRNDPSPHPALKKAAEEGRSTLTEPEARSVLSDVGLEFGPSFIAESEDAVVDALKTLGGPVVVKLVSARITHKSDADGVVVAVATEEDAAEAYRRIREGAERYSQTHDLAKPGNPRVMVVPHLPGPRAELLVGAQRDPGIGFVLTLGAGGIWVEALADVAVRVLPVDDDELRAMLAELRIASLLGGGRGRTPVDLDPVLQAARAVARVLQRWPQVAEVEVNPLFVYDERVVPVDARIVLSAP